jgi:hypothetical protein
MKHFSGKNDFFYTLVGCCLLTTYLSVIFLRAHLFSFDLLRIHSFLRTTRKQACPTNNYNNAQFFLPNKSISLAIAICSAQYPFVLFFQIKTVF